MTATRTVQIIHNAGGVPVQPVTELTTYQALRELRAMAGPRGCLTVSSGRINAYSKRFRYGEDNTATLVAYAALVTR